ncbi:MAG: hypothetical protein APF76_16565 [Desulfitibacter sp. BRH_c19]|nr:MAG: hypothetical protein APF76_16565 [Desulfitibacter sp. BRH_c19]
MSIIKMFQSKFKNRQASYMMVTILAMLESCSGEGAANIDDVVTLFRKFYKTRIENDKLPEKNDRDMANVDSMSLQQIKSLVLRNPVHHLNGLIIYDSNQGLLRFKKEIANQLNGSTKRELRMVAYQNLYGYYKSLDTYQITTKDLADLPIGYAVSAKDISLLSKQNQMKGIHPIQNDSFKAVIILCTIGGEQHPNEWLDHEKTLLKYYLESRTGAEGKKVYNENLSTNRSISNSLQDGYPLYVFVREQKGELFHYEGKFLYKQLVTEDDGDMYFELESEKGEEISNGSIPDVSKEEILKALEEFDLTKRNTPDWIDWDKKKRQKYAILFKNKIYPPKYIVKMATGINVGLFSGGEQTNSYLTKRGFEIIALNNELPGDVKDILGHIYKYIKSKGFNYELSFIQNFLLSLKTKPFLILAGISGTGKTKMVELFAEAVGATTLNGRYNLIPVRPDWNDSTDLLGYSNLQGEFVPGKLTQIIFAAQSNSKYPYFICLDEMNLARVEYYFSEFLSIMESRKSINGVITSAPITVNGLKDIITFPENLYVIGTVNMDETTHPFSRKVLDRANTLEFSEIDLSNFPEQSVEKQKVMLIENDILRSEFLTLKDCYAGNEDFIKEKVKILGEINEILMPSGLSIGYRIRDEFSIYLFYNKRWSLLSEDKAIDYQIMQKILPRIHGSSMGVEDILKELEQFLSSKYPMSKRKIEFMLRRFSEDGFTSFWL